MAIAGRRLDFLRAALVLLVVLTISRVHQNFPVFATLRPALVLAVAAMIYALLNPRLLGDRSWTRTLPARLVAGLALWACLSALFGLSVGRSGRFILEGYSKTIILAFLLMAVIRHPRDLRRYAWAYVISCGLLSLMALTIFKPQRTTDASFERLSDFYTYDANDLGLVVLVGMPLTIMLYQLASARGRTLYVAILLGIGATLARSGSRGAFIGLLAVVAALFVLPGKKGLAGRFIVVAASVAALSVAAPAGYWDHMRTVLRPEEDYNWTEETGRKNLMKRGISYMRQYPLFGVGVSNFPMAEGTISPRARQWQLGGRGIRWTAPHNTYVQAGSEMGVPGLVMWVALTVGAVFRLLKLMRQLPRAWMQGSGDDRLLFLMSRYLPVSIIGFVVASFFLSFAYMDVAYVLVALEVGLTVLTQQSVARAPSPVVAQTPPARSSLSRAVRPGAVDALPSRGRR